MVYSELLTVQLKVTCCPAEMEVGFAVKLAMAGDAPLGTLPPYYTTKTHGTGLELAIVQSVISDDHGSISVESQPGKGATFRIELNAP